MLIAGARAADPLPTPWPTTSAADAKTTVTAEFSITAAPSDLRIGGRLELTLSPTDPAFDVHRITAVTSKPDPDKWENAIEWQLDYSQTDANGAGQWKAVLKPFDTGQIAVPDAIVTWKPAGVGDALVGRVIGPKVNVQSVLPPNVKNPQLMDLRDPIQVARDWTWVWYLVFALIILAAGGWYAWRWWRNREHPAPPEPELPPGLWALHEIDRRSRLPVCTSGPAKAIFTLVSEVVRIYLERRYGISAIDMTTMECLRALQERDPGEDAIRWVQSFLDECDMIKFTRIEPEPERWHTIWNDARMIVQRTTPAAELGQASPAPAGQPEAVA